MAVLKEDNKVRQRHCLRGIMRIACVFHNAFLHALLSHENICVHLNSKPRVQIESNKYSTVSPQKT